MSKSSSNWEDSYFGGVKKILFDYPEIKTPYEIKYNVPDKHDLTYYSKNKLMDLFQLKIKDLALIDVFLYKAEIKEADSWFGKKKYLVPVASSIETCLDNIIGRDTELANLFEHYKGLITNTEFLYPYKDKEEKEKGKGKGDGEKGDKEDKENKEDGEGGGEGENSKETEQQPTPGKGTAPETSEEKLKVAKKMAKELIEEIILRKIISSWGDRPVSGDLKKLSKFQLMAKTNKPCAFTADEISQANQLVKLLDISFDPAKDKVDNLQTGKLDTGKLATVPAGNHHVYYTIEENQTTKPFSVCILCDESGSMGGGEYQVTNVNCASGAQHRLVKILYKAFSQIIPSNKLYIYGHSGHSTPEIRIYHDNYNQVFEYTINRQKENDYQQNYDGPVIECIYDRIRAVTDDNIIFISISDGMPSGNGYGGPPAIRDLKRVIEKCKRDGFVTAGIGVEFGQIKEIYNYHTVIRDLKTMPKKVSLLINQVVKTEFQD